MADMIYDYFRVTGAHDTVLIMLISFSITLRNDDVQEFNTRWNEILLSMTENPTDDVLESLYNSKPHWNCITLKLSKDIETRLSEIENDGQEKHR